MENSGDAIINKDTAGTILTWNEGAEASFGYTAAEAMVDSSRSSSRPNGSVCTRC